MIHIIIVAAGSGSRFGGPLPKQFCDLAGRPVLMHTIEALRQVADATLTLVLSEHDHELWRELCRRHGFESPQVVYGGASRFESVRNALARVGADTDIIMVHDGARPFPSQYMIAALLAPFADKTCIGTLPSLPLTDSIRRIDGDGSEAVDRSAYRSVQTPQVFRAGILLEAYRHAPHDMTFTDDASVVEALGPCRIELVAGDPCNIKITNPGDIGHAEFILEKGRCSH